MRYKLPLLFFLVFVLGFVACKKDTPPQDNKDLQLFASEVKFQPIWIYGNKAMMSFIESHGKKDITHNIQMRLSGAKDWQDVSYTDKNNILLSDLKPGSTYHLRVALGRGADTKYGEVDSFTTLNYFINHDAFFDAATGLYDKDNNILAIESARIVLTGGGFSSVPEIKVQLSAVDNAADVISFNAVVLNDSTLRLDFLHEMIPNSPYALSKTYNCSIGNLALIGQQGYQSNNYFVFAQVQVLNKDLRIEKLNVDKLTCSYITLEGYFGNHSSKGTFPNYIWGVSGKVKERKIIIRDASGGVVKEVLVLDEGAVNCDAEAIGLVDIPQISRTLPSWHEQLRIGLRTSLGTGVYTLEVNNLGFDGVVRKSNAVSFEL